jgi:molybdate-binding protein/DNA-binding XRE family transcriptional regulator
MERLRTRLRRLRQQRELTQQELSRRAGISRQTLSGLEGGRSVPSTALALRLARTLGCRVEDLFSLDDQASSLTAEMVADPGSAHGFRAGRRPARVALGEVDGKWVAHLLPPGAPVGQAVVADGLLAPGELRRALRPRSSARAVTIRPLTDGEMLRENIFVAGCDPALGILSAHCACRPPMLRLTWLNASSGAALDALANGQAHLAGSHLLDEESGEFNVPFVRRLFAERAMLVVNFARWEEGFVVRPGNPRRIRSAADLARSGIRFIHREPGAGARILLQRLLRNARIAPDDVLTCREIAHSHVAVAQAVAMGVADVGVAARAAAVALGLGFVPLAQERFDLVLPAARAEDPRIARLLDTLASRAFRRELSSLGGYDPSGSGTVVAG